MPSRHISSKSFDEILSDLGDDPAIPDPHGIRKSHPTQNNQTKEMAGSNKRRVFEFPPPSLIKHGVLFLALGLLLLAGGIGLFFSLETSKLDSQTTLQELQGQINLLNKELLTTLEKWELDQEELYEIIDELEVSVHSKIITSTIPKPSKQAIAYPHEAELLRWRYLGLSRTRAIEQAFFHTGDKAVMLSEKEIAIGDWQLSQIDTDAVIFTHPKGKSLTLRTSKTK